MRSDDMMKPQLTLLLALLLPALAHAEYDELTELKRSSQTALQKSADRLSNVDLKFEGVVNFGKALKTVEDPAKADVAQLTVTNKDYWRAVLEMAPTDPSILYAHAHLHAARGETAYADAYFLLGSLTMGPDFKAEVTRYQDLKAKLDKRVARGLQVGIQHHDQEEYAESLTAYDEVIAQHPNCAWAYYEKGYSYLMMGKDDPQLEKKRGEMYAACRQRDPFYWRAYQGSDQKVIRGLLVLGRKVLPFVSGKQRDVPALKAFAEGCEEIELHQFAAHARWQLVQLDSDNIEDHLRAFLDLLPKCGCKEAEFFRSQFKFDDIDLFR